MHCSDPFSRKDLLLSCKKCGSLAASCCLLLQVHLSLWAGTSLMGNLCFKGSYWAGRDFVQYALWSPFPPAQSYFLPFLFMSITLQSALLILSQHLRPRGPHWHSGSRSARRKQVVRWGFELGSLSAWLAMRILSQVVCGGHRLVSGIRCWPNCKNFLWWMERMFYCNGLGIWKGQREKIHMRKMELAGCY